MADDTPKWLVWSNEHGQWWRPFYNGYTRVIGEAGRYPHHVADDICNNANFGGQVNEVRVLAPECNDG